MIIESSQIPKRRYSSSTKSKFEFELPKINKTTLLIPDKQKQNTSIIQPSFSQRLIWVIEATNYELLNDSQIQNEYTRLRKELLNINSEVERAVQKLNTRVMKKSKVTQMDSNKKLQVNHKELETGSVVMQRLQKQLQHLDKRLTTINANSKEDIEQEIENTKNTIDKCKIKIKQLKMKNKSIGDSIVGSDDLFQEIKRLEAEKEVYDRKKYKLQTKTDTVYEQISSIEIKLEQMSDNFGIAENYFEEMAGKNQQNEQRKEIQIKLIQARHCLQVLNRKNETGSNLKQQKYHILLKKLQEDIQKLNTIQQKTACIDLEIIHCKKVIQQLQFLYKNSRQKQQILNQQPAFFTQFQIQDENYSDKDDKKQTLDKIKEQPHIQTLQQQIIKKQIIYNQSAKRIQTNNAQDSMEQRDIITDLDQKFKYKTKSNFQSREEKQTEIGEDLPQELVNEQDGDIDDFQIRVKEEKVKCKLKEGVSIRSDLEKIKNNLDKFDFMSANDDSYD